MSADPTPGDLPDALPAASPEAGAGRPHGRPEPVPADTPPGEAADASSDSANVTSHVVRGRELVAVLGAAGALLAVPQLFWPTHSIGVRGEGPTGGYDFRQSIWSWGRYADTTAVDAGQFDVANVFTLVLFSASILVGLAACTAYLLRAGVDGRLLGAAGLGWAMLGLGAPLAQRVGDTVAGAYGDNPLMEVETHVTGWLQWLSVALLVAAFGLVVARPAASTLRAAWPGLVARVARLRESREVDDALPGDHAAFGDASGGSTGDASGRRAASAPGGSAPRVGRATLRDLPPGDRSAGARVVGFSDDADGADGDGTRRTGGLGGRRRPDAP